MGRETEVALSASPAATDFGDSVSEPDLERELARLRERAGNRVGGVFGPDSMIWRVDREAAVFLAAGRAVLLQLAHPWVAAAIAQHSRTLADPIGRFHRTFGVVFTMAFGTTDEALAAARRLHRRHAEIDGSLEEDIGIFAAGSRYRANDVAALRWVHATLAESALIGFELVNPPLSSTEREHYWAEFRAFAAFFGIPQRALPESWGGFLGYVEAMLGSGQIAVGTAARSVAAALFSGAAPPLFVPFWYRALSLWLLPESLRSQFGFRWSCAEERAATRAAARLRWLYPYLPRRLRHVGPYHEALSRIAGRARPGPATRLANRFWIGRPSIAP